MKPLYQRILGDAYAILPQAVQQLHAVTTFHNYSATCKIRRGSNFIANLFANLLSLPKAGDAVKVFNPFALRRCAASSRRVNGCF
jgi:hypothetical protein